jgi:hypothetical protein
LAGLSDGEVLLVTDRSAIFAKLARPTAAEADRRHLADRLCEASRVILGADGAWITVQDVGAQHLPLSATDETATVLEDLQEVFRGGTLPGRIPGRYAGDSGHRGHP